MKNLILFYLFFTIISVFPQTNSQLTIVTGEKSVNIPAFNKEGALYFSVQDFAEVVSANYFYNSELQKIELKFSDYNLKITAENPFYILTSKSTFSSEVYQIPTTTFITDDHIYIPVVYSIEILKKASGIDMSFEKPARIILKDKIPIENIADQEDAPDNLTGSGSGGIYDISIDERANGTLIRVKTDKRILSYSSSFKDDVLKIVFRKVSVDEKRVSRVIGSGLVKEVKAKNYNGDAEFSLRVGKEYSTNEVLNADKGNDILITIHNKVFAREEEKEKTKERWDFDCIVIDPGHGGKDAGAIGVNGLREKDVNLGVALNLGKIIEENMPDVKVVYTRDDDTFVELYKRGKIANENGGKLFLSIHCNSTPKKPSDANGFEVYLLRPGRTQEAIEIAERENSVILYEDNPERYQTLTDENFILVSMAHSAYMRYSEKFSEILAGQFSSDLTLASRGVKQAGFYVLVGASMPSVLIETGFLSNKKDADYLKSKSGQKQIAQSIFEAVKKFKTHYENIVNSEL